MKTMKRIFLAFSILLIANAQSFSINPIKTDSINSIKTERVAPTITISYEIVNVVFVGAPLLNQNQTSYTWHINVVSNIVGNTYPQFYHTDTTEFTFLTTDSQDQIKTKAQTAAVTYITTHYPNH